MNKVICDICGTSYPDTAEQCPICGCTRELRDFAFGSASAQEEAPAAKPAPVKGGRFSTANVRKRNESLHTYQEKPEPREDFPEEEEEDTPRDANNVLVAILLVLIAVLLAITGYIFVKFFLPNIGADQEDTTPSTSLATEESTEETTEEITEEPTIPCESLVLLSDETADLVGIGQYYLVNVEFLPADTTDELVYTSSDETVAVIDDEGRVEVVGEGAVTITVSCGAQQVTCTFNCLAEEPTEETTEETTEATTEPLLNITLFLNRSDFTLSYRGASYQLKFNEELTAEDITWISEDPSIATVENGLVTCVSYGTTKVIAKYGDQEVECIVRCAW